MGIETFNALKKYAAKPEELKKLQEKQRAKPLTPLAPGTYKKSLHVIATAYTKFDEGCGDYTYSGTWARRGVIAVDPHIIPLGTKLYIPGYGNAIAEDIGGAIRGHRIDLFMDTLDEAFTYGRREVTVYLQ